MRTILCSLLALTALGSSPCCARAAPPAADGERGAAPRRRWPAGTPHSQSCAAHADCVVVVAGPGSDPCCDVTLTAAAISRRFLRWTESYRKRHCHGVTCPPLSLPGARLAPCGYEGRCVKRRCTNACDAAAGGGGSRAAIPGRPDGSGRPQPIALATVAAVCRQTRCAGALSRVEAWYDARGRIARLVHYGDLRQCAVPPLEIFDARGKLLRAIALDGVKLGAADQRDIAGHVKQLLGGLVKGGSASCPPR